MLITILHGLVNLILFCLDFQMIRYFLNGEWAKHRTFWIVYASLTLVSILTYSKICIWFYTDILAFCLINYFFIREQK